MSYKLQFIDRSRFMARSLLNLVHNLAKGIHKIKCKSRGIYWIVLCVNGDNVTYFDGFGLEYIPKEIKKLMGNKSITTNICEIQINDSIVLC